MVAHSGFTAMSHPNALRAFSVRFQGHWWYKNLVEPQRGPPGIQIQSSIVECEDHSFLLSHT